MRRTIAVTLATASLALLSHAASAQTAYPEEGRTVELLIGFGTGGATDVAGRLLAQGLSDKLGGTFVVQNVVGAGGLLAVNQLIAAEPDGYTLAIVPLPATNMLYLDPERGGQFSIDDFAIIGMHDYGPIAIAVGADQPWQTLQELVADAKANPGTLTASSSGILAAGHLALLLFSEAAGIEVNWTPTETTGLLLTNAIGGHIDMATDTFVELYPSHQNGDVRILGIFSEERLADFPDIPTAKESGYDVLINSNRILVAPAGTPQEIVDLLEKTLGELAADPAYQEAAAKAQLNMNYLDSDAATAAWRGFDESFAPLVEQFRNQAQ